MSLDHQGPNLVVMQSIVCVPENGALAIKPADLSWEKAAAISLAGNTALFFIRDLAKIQAGQKILIHGASEQ